MSSDVKPLAPVAVVTGGASGIGLEAVRMLAERGSLVTVLDRDQTALDRITNLPGVVGVRCDVTSRAELTAAMATAGAVTGRIDMVFGNAGVPSPKDVVDVSEDDWRRAFAVNVDSCRDLFLEALPFLRKSSHGAVVFTASAAGIMALGNQPAYAASKAAVIGLGRALAAEFAREGIRVNCICPGWVETPMLTTFYESAFPDREEREASLEASRSALPMGRFATPREVAEVALFLLSPAASYMTGAAVPVDGGLTSIR